MLFTLNALGSVHRPRGAMSAGRPLRLSVESERLQQKRAIYSNREKYTNAIKFRLLSTS
jgi:hypothetical protein